MVQYELNMSDYGRIFRKRRRTAILIFFTVLILSLVYTQLQTSTYRASAYVQWIQHEPVGGLLTGMLSRSGVGGWYGYGNTLKAQERIVTSLPVLEKVVGELELAGKNAAKQEIIIKAKALVKTVSAQIIPDTNIIKIDAIASDPEKAALIANKVAEVYITDNLKEKNKQSRSVREFIEKQLAEVTNTLIKSEELLARFKEKEVPSGIALPLENSLAELEAARQKFLMQYTPMHPDVRSIEGQINQVKNQLKELPQRELEYGRLRRDVDINSRLYNELKGRLEAARIDEAEKIADVNLVDPAIPSSSASGPNKPLNYLLGAVIGLLSSIAGVFIIEQLDTSIGTIEEVEKLLELPALGIIPYLRPEEDEAALKKKTGIDKYWSKIKTPRLKRQLLLCYSTSSPVFEAYRILRTNIQVALLKHDKDKVKGKVLLFSSAGPEEGKSVNIANLSIAMAQGGSRVLLIDGDMRRSMIHKVFGLKRKEPGLSDVLKGLSSLEQATQKFTDVLLGEVGFDYALKIPGLDNLNILTSGSTTANPAELLGSKEMADLLTRLRERYDFILFDSPPVLAVADVLILTPKTDGVILVYRVGKIAGSIVLRAKSQIIDSGGHMLGVILNNVSPAVEMSYGYHQHYKYYGKYYDKDKKEEA